MFISSCGATVSAVIGALALPSISGGQNYLMCFIGGIIILAIYGGFALLVKFFGVDVLNKIFPPTIVGPVTMVIGLNLAGFIPTYTNIGGKHNDIAIVVAVATMLVVAIISHYAKGIWKTIPFLVGLAFGYIVSLILTLTGVCNLVDFSSFQNITWYPDITFLKWNAGDFTWGNLGSVALLFIPVAICALLEHYSDHKCLSNIIGTDLTKEPGLHRTLTGDGVASALGTAICGLPNTSYGESIATTGFSGVASTYVITLSAIMLGLLSFIGPVQAFIQSIPSAVFGGCAMILYGYIAASGLKTLINSGVSLEDNKNLIIVSVILTVGVSGLFLFSSSFTGVSLAMVSGVILNLILRPKKEVV